MCPIQYLLEKAQPALQLGAANSERPVPPLVAHIPVALGQDRHEVIAASCKQINHSLSAAGGKVCPQKPDFMLDVGAPQA